MTAFINTFLTITLNHNQFAVAHNTSSAQFWADLCWSEPRLTWTTTVLSSSLSSTVVFWPLPSNVTDLVQSYFTNELVVGSPFYCNSRWFTSCHVFSEWITNECIPESESESYVTTDGQSACLSWNKAPIWVLRPDFYYCQTVAGLLTWAALSDERTGLQLLLSLASAVILRSESHETRDHILLSQILDFPFRRLLWLAGIRWRYSAPPPHEINAFPSARPLILSKGNPGKCSLLVRWHAKLSRIFVYTETRLVLSWSLGIHLQGNVC
jgi:hypothetical protein